MPSASILEDVLQAVKTGVTGLTLSGLSSSNVFVLSVATARPRDLPKIDPPAPFVMIAPFGGETIDPGAGTNLRDDIVYPVLIAILDPNGQANGQTQGAADRDQVAGWRQQIRRLFHNKITAFSGIASVFNSVVQPQAIVDPPMWIERSMFVSGLVVRVSSREARTT